MDQELKIAKKWWDNLTNFGKSEFPHLNPTDKELLQWHSDPAEYSLPVNILY